jgi:enoyl-CoA hydratase/carnithine racemase
MMGLPACPVCGSERVILIMGSQRRAFCAGCGTKWIQDGAEQREIEPHRVDPDHPSLGSRRTSR